MSQNVPFLRCLQMGHPSEPGAFRFSHKFAVMYISYLTPKGCVRIMYGMRDEAEIRNNSRQVFSSEWLARKRMDYWRSGRFCDCQGEARNHEKLNMKWPHVMAHDHWLVASRHRSRYTSPKQLPGEGAAACQTGCGFHQPMGSLRIGRAGQLNDIPDRKPRPGRPKARSELK
jgi:hypothetical protein